MNKMLGVMLSAALICGSAGAAFATTTDQNCETQLHAQLRTLQNQVAQLQAQGNVQSSSPAGYEMPTGG